MGQVLILLAQREIAPTPNLQKTRLQIEENVGEDIHIHYRNLRFEMTQDEFKQFAESIIEAYKRLKDNVK